MSGLRIIIIVVGLVILSPIIALNVWGINMSVWVSETVAQNEAVLNGDTDIPEVRDMPASPLDWLRDRVDLRDTFATGTITNERFVTVAEIVAIEDLLAPGEAMPIEEFVPLYAAARAPARLSPYCADVIESVGVACNLLHSDVRQTRSGKLELIGRLGYIPESSMGDPSSVPNGELIRASVKLPYEGTLRPANDAPTRRALMMQAQSVCDQLRDRFGNCVLGRVQMDVQELWITDLEALPAGTNPERLETRADFLVYADKTVMDSLALRDIVESMVNPS